MGWLGRVEVFALKGINVDERNVDVMCKNKFKFCWFSTTRMLKLAPPLQLLPLQFADFVPNNRRD